MACLFDILLLDFPGAGKFMNSEEFMNFLKSRTVCLKVFTGDEIPAFRTEVRSSRRYCVMTVDPGKYPDIVSNSIVDVSRFTDGFSSAMKLLKSIRYVLTRDGDMDYEKTFFWSDPHFFHKNIIKYCGRPFEYSDEGVARMNEYMIETYNSVVPEDGVCWCLGDFCFGLDKEKTVPEIVSRLNGEVNLVMGNHDTWPARFYMDCGFSKVYDRPVILEDFIILSHEPMQFVKAPFFNIAGHVHTTSTFRTFSEDGCIVCVERHGYRPVPLAEIMKQCRPHVWV